MKYTKIWAAVLCSILIWAGCGGNKAGPTGTVDNTGTDTGVFGTPTNFTAAARNHGAAIHFDRNSKAVSYKLYFGKTTAFEGLGTEYQSSPWSTNGNNLAVNDLDNGTTYYFAVTAVDASGIESAKTATLSVTPAEAQ